MMKKYSFRLYMIVIIIFTQLLTAENIAAQANNQAAVKSTEDPNLKPVFDLDSNQYTVIKIGRQYWLKENLRTTRLNDTTAIATGLTAAEWKQTTNSAYAVSTGRLCPKGWRIPTDQDWKELEKHIGVDAAEINRTGGRSNLAGQLKSPDGWKQNEMTILPAVASGYRNQ